MCNQSLTHRPGTQRWALLNLTALTTTANVFLILPIWQVMTSTKSLLFPGFLNNFIQRGILCLLQMIPPNAFLRSKCVSRKLLPCHGNTRWFPLQVGPCSAPRWTKLCLRVNLSFGVQQWNSLYTCIKVRSRQEFSVVNPIPWISNRDKNLVSSFY